MKSYLRFDLPEDQEEFDDAVKGWKYKAALDDIWNTVFRPYWKHGYNDERLNKILETEDGQYVLDKLIELYQNTTKED